MKCHAGWSSQVALDCTSASNLQGCLAISKRPDVANCILLEAEHPADLAPHMFNLTYRYVAGSQPLILLDADPSCPRFINSAEGDGQAQPQSQAASQLPTAPPQVRGAPLQQPTEASLRFEAPAEGAECMAQPTAQESGPEAAPEISMAVNTPA